jgi:hypothetical protein
VIGEWSGDKSGFHHATVVFIPVLGSEWVDYPNSVEVFRLVHVLGEHFIAAANPRRFNDRGIQTGDTKASIIESKWPRFTL